MVQKSCGFRVRRVSGEAMSANMSAIVNRILLFHIVTENNAPSKSSTLTSQVYSMATLFVYCSANDAEKLPLTIIKFAGKPRVFMKKAGL